MPLNSDFRTPQEVLRERQAKSNAINRQTALGSIDIAAELQRIRREEAYEECLKNLRETAASLATARDLLK